MSKVQSSREPDQSRLEALLEGIGGAVVDFEPQPVWLAQPLHTVYVPADRADEELVVRWRADALTAVAEWGGLETLAAAIGVPEQLRRSTCASAGRKLEAQPIEDLRLDFEDGYGYRDDAEEDECARRGGAVAARLLLSPEGPARIGLRVKPLDTRGAKRGVRTLQLFLEAFLSVPGARERACDLRVTLAKVMGGAQLRALDGICAEFERAYALHAGEIGVELQIEVPHVVAQVREGDALFTLAGHPRVRALHFGTYDYTSAQGIMPGEQRSTHPVARHAKRVMQAAAACHGIEVCDGSSNLLPLGDEETRERAWGAHAEQIDEALRDGLPQGWDLHPTQLPTRFLASYAVLLAELPQAVRRLQAEKDRLAGRGSAAVLDEPATLRMLGALVARALRVGAVTSAELGGDFALEELERIARTGSLAA